MYQVNSAIVLMCQNFGQKMGSLFVVFCTKSNNFISVICKIDLYACAISLPLFYVIFAKIQKAKEQNMKKKNLVKSAAMLLYQPATMAARLLHVKSENNYTLSFFFFVHVFQVYSMNEGASALRGLIIRQMFWAKQSVRCMHIFGATFSAAN